MLLEALDTVDPSTWTLLWKIVALTALPTVAMAVGGVLVQFYQPGPRLTSVLQHFAAGVVFGALALEMLPLLEPVTDWGILAVIGGYIGGVIVMLLVGRTIPHFLGEMDDIIEDHEKHHDDPESKSLVPAEREGLIPWGLVTPVIIDGLIDGTRANARTNERGPLPPATAVTARVLSLLTPRSIAHLANLVLAGSQLPRYLHRSAGWNCVLGRKQRRHHHGHCHRHRNVLCMQRAFPHTHSLASTAP